MKRIEDLLGQIGDYDCLINGEEVHLVGVLRRVKANIVFQAQIELEHYRKLDILYDTLQFWGTVNGTPVTLMSVHCSRGSSSYGAKTIAIEFEPYEVIIGRCYKDEPRVNAISASIIALNHMFSSRPLDLIHNFSKDKPYLLKYTYPDKMEVDDQYGHLEIYQTFSQGWTRDEIKHSIVPIIEYRFGHTMSIMDAVGRIAAARNLFSFFANGYLPLENIKFADDQSQKFEELAVCDITLYLNHPEDIPLRDEPFLIMTSAFKDNFSQIWKNWLDMYEGAVPIPTLFYEIICNRSTRVNCFLNLVQAIEVYSNQYRGSEVEELARKRENTKQEKKPKIYLKYKLEDVFSSFNDCLEIAAGDIPILAEHVADMRNFYTHYNANRYAEPTYQEMFSATHVLRFVLLAIVYKTLGLSSETIIDARKRVEFQLYYKDIEAILHYANEQEKNS